MGPHASQNIVTKGSQETGVTIGQMVVMPNKCHTENPIGFRRKNGIKSTFAEGPLVASLEVEGVI